MKEFYTMAIIAASCFLHKAVCADKVKIANVAENKNAGKASNKNAANNSEEKKRYMLESRHHRSLRGSTDSSSYVIENESRNLIIGGKEISENEYPYLAYLKIFKSDEKIPEICGGTLIQPNWILTAAHCAYGALNITAMLGVHETSTSAGEPGVEQHFIYDEDIHIYPVYDSRTDDGDFSLLYLKAASNKTTPIVNTDIFVPAECDMVSVVGWGVYDVELPFFHSNVPKEASLQVVDPITCKVAYADMIQDNSMVITNDMICATGWANDSSCKGDSGGPVVVKDPSGNPSKDVLVGVVSFGDGCNKPNRPDVYGRVSAAMSWLTTMTSPSSPSPAPTKMKITNPIASSLDPTPVVLTSPEPSILPATSIPSHPPSPSPQSLSWSFNLT